MGECPEFGCETRLPRQPDDEIRAPPGIMERGADLARAQGRDGGLGQRFDGARLVGLPVNHREACGPQGRSRLLLVMACRHMEKCEAGPQISANQPRQGNGFAFRNGHVGKSLRAHRIGRAPAHGKDRLHPIEIRQGISRMGARDDEGIVMRLGTRIPYRNDSGHGRKTRLVTERRQPLGGAFRVIGRAGDENLHQAFRKSGGMRARRSSPASRPSAAASSGEPRRTTSRLSDPSGRSTRPRISSSPPTRRA